MPHKAGFVNIVGKPNVGKSTLMNAFVEEPGHLKQKTGIISDFGLLGIDYPLLPCCKSLACGLS